jgi:anti-sigma regulatory factor (Ser/Thr protein kinase)
VKEAAEVRLYETAQGGQAKLVGCYEFLLNNYVRAYQELNRNCIELHVQIAENYIIVYDVFIERTE